MTLTNCHICREFFLVFPLYMSILRYIYTYIYIFLKHWARFPRSFLFIYLFIYLWLCRVFVSVRGLSLVATSGGHSSSRCAGLSLSRPLLLWSTGSRRAGSVVVAHGPSCSAACGIFPDKGSNPCSLHWQADSQPLRHQGSPILIFLTLQIFFFSNEVISFSHLDFCFVHRNIFIISRDLTVTYIFPLFMVIFCVSCLNYVEFILMHESIGFSLCFYCPHHFIHFL